MILSSRGGSGRAPRGSSPTGSSQEHRVSLGWVGSDVIETEATGRSSGRVRKRSELLREKYPSQTA